MPTLTITVTGTDSGGASTTEQIEVGLAVPLGEESRREVRDGLTVGGLANEQERPAGRAPGTGPMVTRARRSEIYEKFTGGYR